MCVGLFLSFVYQYLWVVCEVLSKETSKIYIYRRKSLPNESANIHLCRIQHALVWHYIYIESYIWRTKPIDGSKLRKPRWTSSLNELAIEMAPIAYYGFDLPSKSP